MQNTTEQPVADEDENALSPDEVGGDQAGSEQAAPDSFVREGFEEIARKTAANEDLTDEELDKVADLGIGILRSVLSYFDAADATIDEYDGTTGQLIFNIVGKDLGVLIGYHGKVLDSFKFMFSTLLNNELGFRFPATVDIEGYESRRLQKLEGLARSSARKAVQRHCEVRLHPMKPYERRIVHLTLRGDTQVVTHSEGTEPNRYVVVAPAD